MKKYTFIMLAALAAACCEAPQSEPPLRPSEYVSTLVGTQSDYTLSTGNTYPPLRFRGA